MSDSRLREPAPWIPLEGLMQQWAGLALEEAALRTSEVTLAVSFAFTALAHEQGALAAYRRAVCCGHEVLHDYESVLHELQQGATAWMQAACALDRHLHYYRVEPEHAAPLRKPRHDLLDTYLTYPLD